MRRHPDAGSFERGDLRWRIALTTRNDRAGVTHAAPWRRGAARDDALRTWRTNWNAWVEGTFTAQCASPPTPASNVSALLNYMLPRVGSVTKHTRVRIFGRGFHRAICGIDSVLCKFGDRISSATIVSTTQLLCDAIPPDNVRGGTCGRLQHSSSAPCEVHFLPKTHEI